MFFLCFGLVVYIYMKLHIGAGYIFHLKGSKCGSVKKFHLGTICCDQIVDFEVQKKQGGRSNQNLPHEQLLGFGARLSSVFGHMQFFFFFGWFKHGRNRGRERTYCWWKKFCTSWYGPNILLFTWFQKHPRWVFSPDFWTINYVWKSSFGSWVTQQS